MDMVTVLQFIVSKRTGFFAAWAILRQQFDNKVVDMDKHDEFNMDDDMVWVIHAAHGSPLACFGVCASSW